MPDILIVDPNDAPQGRRPELRGTDYIKTVHGRYYTECWSLTDGNSVVIVRWNNGMSLMNASDSIAAAIDARWYDHGDPIVIIEDWAPQTHAFGTRFVESSRTGGSNIIDFDHLDNRGIVLPR